MSHRIVLVGHCGVDAPRLEAAVSRILPRADVISVNSEEQLQEICDDGADLLLINRQLPYGFESEEGVELMCELQEMHPDVKMMLVSDRPDAQERAMRAGAVEGFGKADLGSSRIAEILKDALKGQQSKPN
jgi:DNA-binding NarL/FixJ family response regulator